jgi:tRNA threonylcarbamoyladenosine biosynthesis protein TsaB
MKILAIETATEACSAALAVNGEIVERYALAPREHNRMILPMIASLLAEAGATLTQLDALAFGRGPGSFTGVRIAAGVVQGLAFGADLPVAPVSTLAALAQEAFAETVRGYAFPCIDARMKEVYWAVYRRDGDGFANLVGAEAVVEADQVLFPREACGFGIGSGWGTYRNILHSALGQERVAGLLKGRFPRASWIAHLALRIVTQGGCVSADAAQPVYLRDNVARKPVA